MSRSIVLAGLLGLAACGRGATGGPSTTAAPQVDLELEQVRVTSAIEQWRQAHVVRALDVLEGLYAQDDQVTRVHQGRAVIGWAGVRAALASVLEATDVRLELSNVAVLVHGEVATAVGNLRRERVTEVTTTVEVGIVTLVWVRDGATWVIAQEHFSFGAS